MKILASLQNGARHLLGIPSGITPSASLPVAEVPSVMRSSPSLPSAHATSMTPIAAAPVASRPAARSLPPVADMIRSSRNPRIGPGETIADYVDKKLAEALGNPLVVKAAGSSRAPVAKAKPKPSAPVPPPSAPAADDDDDSGDSLDSVYDQLQQVLEILKQRQKPTADDDADMEEAAAFFKRGNKAVAVKRIMALTNRFSARAAREAQWLNITPHGRMALSFGEQPAVASLEAALRSRPGPVAAAKPATEPLSRFREIESEIAALDKEQRRRFTNEGQAKHSALRREQAALRSKFRP